MNSLRKKIVMVVATVVIFSMGFISGCRTCRGFAADVEDFSGAVRRGLDPIEKAQREAEARRAAELVLARREITAK